MTSSASLDLPGLHDDSPASRNQGAALPSPTAKPSEPPAKPSSSHSAGVPRPRLKRAFAFALVAATIVAGSVYGYRYYRWAAIHETTDNAFIDGHIIQVSSRVSGHVSKLYVSDNQEVKAGDPLLDLDPADFQAALEEANGKHIAAQADLQAARSAVDEANAQVAAAKAVIAQSEAEFARRQAELDRAHQDLAEYTKARDNHAISPTEWGKADTAAQTATAASDAARKAVNASQAQLNQALAAVAARQGQVAVAQAQIKTAEAAVEKARLNLSYTRLTAPSNGRITRKSVEPGNYLLQGQPLMALVSPEIWVTANFKETQLAQMTPGQKVTIEVDAYPGLQLRGHVDSIQQGAGARFSLLPPENATGNYVKVVQRVPVKIVLDELPSDGRTLGPGMSVVPVVSLKN